MQTERLFAAMMDFYAGDPHQIQHLIKVHSFAMRIAAGEALDARTCEMLACAAIVHDVGIKPAVEKYGSGAGPYQEIEGPPVTRAMLEELGFDAELVDRVCYLVGHHHTYGAIDGLDYQILVEADFLVNMHEGGMERDTMLFTLDNIFKTGTGRHICKTMFALG